MVGRRHGNGFPVCIDMQFACLRCMKWQSSLLLREDIGSVGVADLLFVVLVADASSNAMQGGYRSIGDGLVLVGTMVGWNYAPDWLAFRSDAVSRLLEPQTEVLIRHGRVNGRCGGN